MREIWRGGLALARNDFGSCVALAGADNFAQKIKNRAVCCESLTWRGFDFRAVFSQNCLFFKSDLTLNFSFIHPATQKKYAQFSTTLHAKFGKFLQISSAKFALYLAIFKFIFARKMEFKIALDLINFALLNLNHKKCALKPDFAPLRRKWCLNLRPNFATILHLKLITNLQLLSQISQFIFAINSHFNLRQSKNLVLNSPTNLNLHKNFHLNLQPNLSIISCFLRPNLFKNLRPNSHIYLNLRRNLLINSRSSRKDCFSPHYSRTIFKVKLSRKLFAILSLRPNLLLNLLEILRSLHQILPPKSALYQNLILRKSFCCDLHLSSSEKSRANSRWVKRISCEKVA